MINITLLLGLGVILLYFGAEWMVKGGSRLAGKLGVSRLVIGLTVVAFGTSLPELMVSMIAALKNSESIAIGNVIGSNIANVGLVLGLSALIFPLSVHYRALARELWIYTGVMVVFLLFCLNGIISRPEGLFLFTGILLYTLMHMKHPPPDLEPKIEDYGTIPGNLFLLVAGIAALALGAQKFVDGAVQLAVRLGIDEVVIGMTIVALGTSLPELATSVVAAFRKESGISIGNIIGSNMFNILSVIGLVSIIHPMPAPRSILSLEIPIMMLFGLVLFPVARMRQPIPRISSALLILGYIGMIFLLVLRA